MLNLNRRKMMFEKGFPNELQSAVQNVIKTISTKTEGNVSIGFTEEPSNEKYTLSDGSIISFPYRIYYIDDDNVYGRLSSKEERLIYDCIFTRNCNGYVREKHLKNMLSGDIPEWCMPYVLRISSEYVLKIVEDIYAFMINKDNRKFQSFCEFNPYMFKTAYSRMTSYWNEFYREDCCKFHDYVGYKLYKQCFRYSARYDRLNRKNTYAD